MHLLHSPPQQSIMIYKNCEITLFTQNNEWRALIIRGTTLDEIERTKYYATRDEAISAAKELIDAQA